MDRYIQTWYSIQPILKGVNIISITLRLGLALIFGGIIGLERGKKRRPAGFRTYMLVCMGAALAMTTNQYIFETMGGSDPVRLGAQVVSGIGFLGAGTIIVTGRNQVKGLTTAAALWASACMGLALGIGFYSGAIIALLYIMIATRSLHKINNKVNTRSKVISLYIEFNTVSFLSDFLVFAKANSMMVAELDVMQSNMPSDSNIAILLTLKADKRLEHIEIIRLLKTAKGVRHIEEI